MAENSMKSTLWSIHLGKKNYWTNKFRAGIQQSQKLTIFLAFMTL